LIPTAFTIGIDDNLATGSGLETLVFFKTFICTTGTTPATCALDGGNSYIPGTPTAIPDNANGNGFSDATLKGFALAAGTKYLFEASVSNDSDGMEEFFIIPGGNIQIVPEPRLFSLILLGSILMAIVYRKRASVR
jgi:hypothetical protein